MKKLKRVLSDQELDYSQIFSDLSENNFKKILFYHISCHLSSYQLIINNKFLICVNKMHRDSYAYYQNCNYLLEYTNPVYNKLTTI